MSTAINNISWSRRAIRFIKRNVLLGFYRSKLVDNSFPPEVWIENTNHCNATCVMCPREKLTRAHGVMRFELFEKIIKEIAVHNTQVMRVHLHNYGEPLIDAALTERIRLAKGYGIRHTYIVTNGSLLTPPIINKLIDAGLDEMKISFYGTDRNTYNKTMVGLDYDTTIARVHDFFRIRRERKKNNPKVIIQYLPQESNNAQTDKFCLLFLNVIDKNIGDSLNIFSLHNYGDGRNYRCMGKKCYSICDYPWRTMVILYDGTVVPCCLDFNGALPVGDVHNNTVEEIWNGPVYNKMRDDFKKLRYDSYSLCKRCCRVR